MTTERPLFLDVTKMRFPVTAVISISHRISGVIIFLFIPFCLYLLSQALGSAESFYHLKAWLAKPGIAFLLWILLSAVAFHLIAGIRHLLMDCGFGEHMRTARITAYVVMAISLVCIILLGVWVW